MLLLIQILGENPNFPEGKKLCTENFIEVIFGL
jgi:hypothetical protein